MSELPFEPGVDPEGTEGTGGVEVSQPLDRSSASIRSQLLWSSLFPLLLFGLLCTLAFSAALNQLMENLALQRNTAQVQLLAASLAEQNSVLTGFNQTVLDGELNKMNPANGSELFLIDSSGHPIAASPAASTFPLDQDAIIPILRAGSAGSRLIESPITRDKVLVSYTIIPSEEIGVLVAEPWPAVMAPAYAYQFFLAALLAVGIALSLGMLSLSIGRVIRPLTVMAEKAVRAVPDSIFHPLPVYGPAEIRRLTEAFNHMVIRLAEQQSSLRQYAHKALLSQEQERERLSHELHDGTLQDLLSLSQRVELCRNELDHDPQLARKRLDELQYLLEQSVNEVRRISNALRPPVLEDLGLAIALNALCKDLQQERPALRCEFAVAGPERRLQADLELAVFRVVQEALANIRKHVPDASWVRVELTFDREEVRAVVTNDGAAFIKKDMRALVRSGHLGLAGMYERTRLFGGSLEIAADARENTVASLRIPCPRDSFYE